MLLREFENLFSDPVAAMINIAAFAVALVVGITVHEFSHAWSATKLGDDTALRQGRLTLNPIRHLDLLGTILILMAGFGWGKPTPVNPFALRIGPKAGMALVAIAGPVSNVIIAALAALPARFGALSGGIETQIVFALILWNLVLAVFNLLPIAPLDGFKVALGVLPNPIASQFARTERFGIFILLGVVIVDSVFGTRIIARIIFPAIIALVGLFLGVDPRLLG